MRKAYHTLVIVVGTIYYYTNGAIRAIFKSGAKLITRGAANASLEFTHEMEKTADEFEDFCRSVEAAEAAGQLYAVRA